MTCGSLCTSAGRALGDLLAEVQHGDAVGDPHDQPHVVLDQQDGAGRCRGSAGSARSAPPSPPGSARRPARRAAAASARWPARGRSPAGAGRRRTGSSRSRSATAGDADELQQLQAAAAALLLLAGGAGAARAIALSTPVLCRASAPTITFSSAVMLAKSRMFWNVRATPEPVDQVRPQPGDPLAAEADLARGRRVDAGDDVEDRRLAGAVRADQREDLALGDR